MVRKSDEKQVDKFEHKFGADGYITVHVHNGDTEIYYVLSGKAKYNDNGTLTTIEAGDVTFTPSGTGHGIENDSDEPLDIIALIIYS